MDSSKCKHRSYCTLFIILALLVGCLGVSCQRDEEEITGIFTGKPTEINENGATFHGLLRGADLSKIDDHGFVWSTTGQPTLQPNALAISLGKASEASFSVRMTTRLKKQTQYYVRAWYRMGLQVFYGSEMEFLSLGSTAPIITSFEPPVATWGDEITIHGMHLQQPDLPVEIRFGTIKAEILQVSDTLIITRVPATLTESKSLISVSILDNTTESQQEFQLSPPVIDEFYPKKGIFPGTINIKGENFRIGSTKVFLDSVALNLLFVSSTEIMVRLPDIKEDKFMNFRVEVAGQETISDDTFHINFPSITHFEPQLVTWGDILTIHFTNFDGTLSSWAVDQALAEIRFGTQFNLLQVSDVKENKLVFQIPDWLDGKTGPVSIRLRLTSLSGNNPTSDFTIGTNGLLTFKEPEITSVSPLETVWDGLVEIHGKNFNPATYQNVVRLGPYEATVVSTSNNLITFRWPKSTP